jgi:peptidylprolyl isomerase
MNRLRTLVLAAAATASGLGLAACSSGSSSSTTSPSSTVPADAPTTTVVTQPVASPSPAGTFGTKPTVVVPTGPPPTTLQVTDLITGTGPKAKPGDQVTVQYVGYAYSNKQQFDASWDRGQPFDFALGQGQVIAGWDDGVVGMQVGGRRELIIPPNLAYGANSPTPQIAANDTLVFIVDLVKVNSFS